MGTYETNKMVGLNNLRLVWKGPYVRTEGVRPEQEGDAIRYDVLSVAKENCDAVIFLLFNKFSEDCKTTTTGHKFGGVSYGGMCEVPDGRGYAVVVDQVLKLILIKEQNILYKIEHFCRCQGFLERCMDWTSDPRPPPSSHAYQ